MTEIFGDNRCVRDREREIDEGSENMDLSVIF